MGEDVTTTHDVVLKAGRDRSVRRRHPWLLAGSIESADPAVAAGAWVRVVSAEGEALGYGHYAPDSRLRVRLLAFGTEAPREDLLLERIRAAIGRRAAEPGLADSDAVRLVNAEGDGLPGLVVDRYADVVVLRITSAGMAARRDAQRVAAVLFELPGDIIRRNVFDVQPRDFPVEDFTSLAPMLLPILMAKPVAYFRPRP